MSPRGPESGKLRIRRPCRKARAGLAARLRRAARGGIPAVAVLLSSVSFAQADPDMSLWRCALCRFEHGTQAQYTAGTAYVSDGAARFADGNGYDRHGGYLLAGSEGRLTDEHQRIVWEAEDLGLDARSLSLTGTRAGTIDYRLRYRELPHYLFDTTATVFRSASGGQLGLPSGWVRAPVTSQMSALDQSLVPQKIASQRENLELGIRFRPRDSIQVHADYRRQELDGTSVSGASFSTTASQLPRPIDQYTDELSVGLRFLTSHGTLDLGYRGSFFDNRLESLTWDNPFSSPLSAERGSFAESPDNSFQNLLIEGAFHFLESTTLTFAAGAGHGVQDEALLSYTLNPQLMTRPLPRTTLDGSVDTSHAALTVTARPWSHLRLRASYRYDEHDNKTPIATWNRVITDAFNSTATENNVAYDFERARLSLVADAHVSRRLRFSAGYDRTTRDRNAQEVAGQTEDAGWGRMRWRFAPAVELSVRRGTARRDIDRYDTALAAELLQNPLLAKYNLAYRFRTYADLSLSAAGSKRPFSFVLSTFYADDDYTRSRLGLTSDDDFRLAADFGWTFTPHVSVYASISDEAIDSRQRGSESFAAPDWTARNEDRFRTFAGGLQLEQVLPRLDLNIDMSLTDSETGISLTSGTGPDSFPELRSKLDGLRLKATYRRSQRLSLLLALRYEHLDTEDWALAGVEPATIPELLSLGADPFRYRVVVLGAGVNYRLGAERTGRVR
jgi:MtrB/PioB family decaheme-associated outer membrane protein